MLPYCIRKLVRSTCGLLIAVVLVLPAAAGEAINTDADDLAIRGYDPVAYFTEGRPVKGQPQFEHVWHDARWRFANAEHAARFTQDPEAYAPQYGGFCAGAMALGWKAPIDPEAWTIVDGRLYLNYSKSGQEAFTLEPEPRIVTADENWKVLGKTD